MLVEFKAEIAPGVTHSEIIDTEELRREHGISYRWDEYSESFRNSLVFDWWEKLNSRVKLSYEEVMPRG